MQIATREAKLNRKKRKHHAHQDSDKDTQASHQDGGDRTPRHDWGEREGERHWERESEEQREREAERARDKESKKTWKQDRPNMEGAKDKT